MSEWKHMSKFKGRTFVGKYGKLNGDRVFQLIPNDGLGGVKSFESFQEAKKKGYLKVK